MPSALGRILQRIQGFIDGDGVKDSSLYLQNHQLVADLVGTDSGVAAILVRALDPRTNAPSAIFQINKDGTLVTPAVAQLNNTAPTNSAPGDAAASGASAQAARRDHTHGRESWGSAGDIAAVNTAAAAGSSGKTADAAHVHTITDQAVTSRKVALTSSTQDVATTETTTSTSYTDLSTSGPAVTLTPGVTQTHLILFKAWNQNSAGGNSCFTSVAVAGAAASDADAGVNTGTDYVNTNGHILASSQSSGATHTTKYRVAAGTGSWQHRRIVGVAL